MVGREKIDQGDVNQQNGWLIFRMRHTEKRGSQKEHEERNEEEYIRVSRGFD